MHEFLHIREMYAKPDLNILKNRKNRIPENEKNMFTKLPMHEYNIILNICYLFNKSEERARLNEIHIYIKNNKLIDDKVNNKLQSIYLDYILETNILSSIVDMKTYIDNVEMRYSGYLFIEALSYYMKKYTLSKISFSKYHFNMSNNELYNLYFTDSKYANEYTNIYNHILDMLSANYDEYLKKLKNIIYFSLNDNKSN